MSTQTIKSLNKLANLNKDAYEFYEQASESTDSAAMKTTFVNLSTLHKGVTDNLQKQIRSMGEQPDTSETFGGQMAQLWGKLKAAVSNDTDEAFVTELEEAEDRCLHQMQDIMNSDDVTPEIKAAISGEAQTLRKTHDFMKDLKDSMKDAA